MIKRVILTLSTVFLLTGPALPPAPVARREPRPLAQALGLPRISFAAHRGGALEVPENSMSGLRTALMRSTAQVLDFDTRMLQDGTPVVMHDATLDRTTDMSGPVRNLGREEWDAVRILPRPELGPGWWPERPPTVAEVLDEFGGLIILTLEAKDPESLPTLVQLIKERGLQSSVFINTNSPSLARKVSEYGLLTQLWRSAAQIRNDRPEQWRDFVDMLDVDHQARDADLRKFVRSGVPLVWAHTVDTPQDRNRVLRLGCNGILTDAPGLLAAVPSRGRQDRSGLFSDTASAAYGLGVRR